MSVVHRSRGPPASRPRAQLRSEPAIVGGPRARGARRAHAASRGSCSLGLRPDPRRASSAWCPASTTTTAACASPGGFVLPSGARQRRFDDADGPRALHACTRCPTATLAPRPLPADDAPQPRPVQHHGLRLRRPLPRASPATAASCCCTPTTSRRRACARAQRGRRHQPLPRRDAHAARLPRWWPTTCRAAARPPTSRRRTRWCRSTASPTAAARRPTSRSRCRSRPRRAARERDEPQVSRSEPKASEDHQAGRPSQRGNTTFVSRTS